jgi:hypothetical protein
MRESETFDAFYARTVSSVTSQMHALAAGDPQADHAIREAYARAYQQWFEVSGYRDPDGWVLEAAKDAFARRQAQAEIAGPPAARPDSGTWPGMYRERRPAPPDPDATVAPGVASPAGAGAATAGSAGAGVGQGYAPTAQAGYQRDPHPDPAAYADPFSAGPGGGYGAPGAPADPQRAPAGLDGAGRAGATAGMGGVLARPGSGRVLLAVAGVIVLAAVAVGGYFAFGRGHNSPAAGPPASSGSTGPPPVQMLGAGKTGPRSAVPWSLVGSGWVLAEFSPGQPGSAGGPVSTYLVDPKGGRYSIAPTWPASTATTLIAWSGDTKTALFGTASGGSTSYSLLNVRTGVNTALNLPAGVAITGFTRPDGLNLLAIQQGPARYKLERYNLQGAYQATLATMVRRGGQPQWTGSCSSGCGALSSTDGDTAVWGVTGDEMQLVDNAGGIIRRLHVPDSGSPPSCTPVSWWDTATVLASCAATGQPGESRLWLIPVNGSTPTPETLASGSGSGDGIYTGAWQAGGQVYVTATSSSQCPSAASGPGGLGIFQLASSGSDSTVSVPGSTSYHNAIVGSSGGRLLVLAQTSCPGTTSLEWFSPGAGSTQPLLPATSGQAGVVAAVAFSTS